MIKNFLVTVFQHFSQITSTSRNTQCSVFYSRGGSPPDPPWKSIRGGGKKNGVRSRHTQCSPDPPWKSIRGGGKKMESVRRGDLRIVPTHNTQFFFFWRDSQNIFWFWREVYFFRMSVRRVEKYQFPRRERCFLFHMEAEGASHTHRHTDGRTPRF